MPGLPTVFDLCKPRPEVLAGELPDSLFAADLWDVIVKEAHPDYLEPDRFFAGTHPTENLKFLVREATERLAGVEGGTPVFRLETGFGGGKTHSLIATVHVAREGNNLANLLSDYRINQYPRKGEVKVAAFVGEESDPLSGTLHAVEGQEVRTFTPWGQIALMAGGPAGYELVRENDLVGIAPARATFEKALGDKPVLILIDELVLYMARAFALPENHPRSKVNSQWATFLQVLFAVASRRPTTVVILTLPSEQDANRKLTGELKQFIPTVLETVDELEKTTARNARNLTPTQSNERAAVLGRRLFEKVDTSRASEIAQAYMAYLEDQRRAGVQIDNRAFEASYMEQLRAGYPFHPELIRLFADRLADISEFQATRGALRLVARTIRAVWDRKNGMKGTLLLQPHHVDLSRSEMRDEILGRLGRGAFERGLDADVTKPEGGTHASEVELGWPWRAATETSLIAFLHSLPDGSRGITASEAALAVGRPGIDLAYAAKGLDETERRAWYMRRDGDYYLFRTRASVNKRFQERLAQVLQDPGVVKQTLDEWVREVYSGFESFQVIPFPVDHTAITDTADRLRLAIIHYDVETGEVGRGDLLSFTKDLFQKTGVNASPRRYRNNITFLMAERTRVAGLKDAVRSLIAWERVKKDIEAEQANLAQASGAEYRALKEAARRGAPGVSTEFMALESDVGEVNEKLGTQELNVRSRLLEAYRVLAFPQGSGSASIDLFNYTEYQVGPMLECFRIDFGETPGAHVRGPRAVKQAVAEGPILQCLRQHNKLVPEPTQNSPVVLAPEVVKRAPLWQSGERYVSTEEIWDRLRREPDLPIVLKPADLLPTFRAGITANPDSLWTYYNREDKRVYNRSNAAALAPVLSPNHLIYDPAAASQDRIFAVASIAPQEVWDHLWPRDGVERRESVTSAELMEGAKGSGHFPVVPDRTVLWQALQEGARDNRWVLFLRDSDLAIGAQEMAEWPGTPRIDQNTEVWTYQAALDRQLYPRQNATEESVGIPLTPTNLKAHCWPSGAPEVLTEDLERYGRNIWKDLRRPQLEELVREGVRQGIWGVWKKGTDETFYSREDASTAIQVGSSWSLVNPESNLANQLEPLRPGRGPQPLSHAGTPREVLTALWEQLATYRDVQISEMTLTVTDRGSFDNTLVATWADRPATAAAHVSIQASGEREVGGKRDTVRLEFEGRFEEVRAMLAPIWPFQSQGELEITISVRLLFTPALELTDRTLEGYRDSLMNANQGVMEARVVPVRSRR